MTRTLGSEDMNLQQYQHNVTLIVNTENSNSRVKSIVSEMDNLGGLVGPGSLLRFLFSLRFGIRQELLYLLKIFS